MLICVECSNTFDRPRLYKDKICGEPLPFDEWYGCPYCGGEFTTLHTCSLCNESITEDCILLKTGEYICSNCFETVSIH